MRPVFLPVIETKKERRGAGTTLKKWKQGLKSKNTAFQMLGRLVCFADLSSSQRGRSEI